jgi:hypothetical protein|tara:strand:+ start:360 stop:1109 length:750 start_codon:yes stop_codon:yes gene_type:complete
MANSKSSKSSTREAVTSEYCHESDSSIHQSGLFATRSIAKDTEIIEYVGEIISKKEADERGQALLESSAGTDNASVYIFILDDDRDIDGAVPYNTARLINHSCKPNCEAQIVDDEEIWIVSLTTIAKGEELTFDYGFDLEHYEDHPCRCGKPNCVGYIVAKEHWPELSKLVNAKAKKKTTSKGKKKSETKKAYHKKNATVKKPTSKKKTSNKASEKAKANPKKKVVKASKKKVVKASKKARKKSAKKSK